MTEPMEAVDWLFHTRCPHNFKHCLAPPVRKIYWSSENLRCSWSWSPFSVYCVEVMYRVQKCKSILARFREWLADILRLVQFWGGQRNILSDLQNLAGVFLHNSVYGSPKPCSSLGASERKFWKHLGYVGNGRGDRIGHRKFVSKARFFSQKPRKLAQRLATEHDGTLFVLFQDNFITCDEPAWLPDHIIIGGFHIWRPIRRGRVTKCSNFVDKQHRFWKQRGGRWSKKPKILWTS